MKSLNEILKMKDPSTYLYEAAYKYAHKRLKPKWERLLLRLDNPGWAYFYTRGIIKGRWLEAEEYIIKDPRWAYYYRKNRILFNAQY